MKNVVFAFLLIVAAAALANSEEMSQQILTKSTDAHRTNGATDAVNGAPPMSEVATPHTGISSFDCRRDPGSQPYTVLFGVNNAGAIVGTCAPGNAIPKGFVFVNGAFAFLQGMTAASGINNLGQIVGYNGGEGVLYSNGIYSRINYPGAEATYPLAINDHGTIVGVYQISNVQHGFIFSNATYTTWDYPGAVQTYLGGINNAGQLVGSFCVGTCQVGHGFLVTGSTYTQVDYPGAQGTAVYGINNLGVLVGGYNNEVAFIYDHGSYTSFDFNNSPDTAFQSINDLGEFVGYWTQPPASFYGLKGYWLNR